MNALNKIVTALFWLLVLVVLIGDFEGVLSWLPIIGLFVLAIHVLEIIYFWNSLKQRSQRPKVDAFYILIFGIFHLKQFMQKS